MKIKSFRQLYAWQEAHKLALSVYSITKDFPKEEKFGLIGQMRRAVVSITSNISEGFSRRNKREKAQFLYVSHGSLTELENQLLLSRDLDYISPKQLDELLAQSMLTSKLINGLIKSSKLLST